MKLGMQVNPAGDPAPPKKVHSPLPQFSAHVYCGQMAGFIRIPLGTEVGLSPGDIVLDGDPAPPAKNDSPPIFGPCLVAKRLYVSGYDFVRR